MPSPQGFDAYSPEQIAERVETYGTYKARQSITAICMLGILGGGFIGLGAMVHTVILADPALDPGAGRIVAGLFFAMGYMIAISAGAEVFTTNNLLVMSWAARQISTRRLMSVWGLVLVTNAVGAIGLVITVILSGHLQLHDGEVARTAVAIGAAKAEESFVNAFFKGVLGNLLIAMGLWVAMAGRSVTDKVLGPWIPIAALPIAGFEHSVGNLYYLPMGMLVANAYPELVADAAVSLAGSSRNLVAVILGNVLGGGVMVALVYHLVYRRAGNRSAMQSESPADDTH